MFINRFLPVRSVLFTVLALFLTSVLAFGIIAILPKSSPLPIGNLTVFSAPSQVPAGEHWVLVGSRDDLPADLVATALAEGVKVLETQKVSARAFFVKLQVPVSAPGKLLRVSSAAQFAEAELELYLGEALKPLMVEANIQESDLVDGHILVDGPSIVYGYHPNGLSPLAALRIHNRQNGQWRCHEHALEKARQAAEPKEAVGLEFQAVDPFITLPDTDGDAFFDFEEAPEPRDPVPDQLGVDLVPGTNILDVVAADEAGNAAWKTLLVYTSFLGN
jgi:hypothetical protein